MTLTSGPTAPGFCFTNATPKSAIEKVKSATKLLQGLYKAFLELDASLLEINPLIVTGKGEVMALDAKMNFDDNALYRHKDVEQLRDEDEEDPTELEAASSFGSSSVSSFRAAMSGWR